MRGEGGREGRREGGGEREREREREGERGGRRDQICVTCYITVGESNDPLPTVVSQKFLADSLVYTILCETLQFSSQECTPN